MNTTTGTIIALIEDCASDLSLLPILADALEDCGESGLAKNIKAGNRLDAGMPEDRPYVLSLFHEETSPFLSAWVFFARNAGYCTPPGPLACAWELAMAERHAEEEGWECEWTEDYEPAEWQNDRGEWESGPAMNCALVETLESEDNPWVGRHILASLGNIALPISDEYKRVVEAELAQEAMNNKE